MPAQNIHVVQEVGTLAEAYEQLAKLQKTLRYLLNGQIDFENIRARSIKADNIEVGTLTAEEIAANTITADKMDVDELSAITANLGTILAGLIIGIQIYGSYIATAQETYPRSEMSSTGNLFGAYLTADNYIVIAPDGWNSVPALRLSNGNVLQDSGISNPNGLRLESLAGITLQAGTGALRLFSSSLSGVRVANWGSFFNDASGNDLQSELSSLSSAIAGKANAFSGHTGSVTIDGTTLNYSNGVLTSVT